MNRPFRRTTVGDFFDPDGSPTFTVVGMRLAAGAAAASAQVTDGDGTVLADLAAPANGSDSVNVPVAAVGKVALAAIAGAGAIVTVYVR